MTGRSSRVADLREACIREALAIIETSGIEELSLREIARRLGVSHQAPYKHFTSRDHILAEIVRRAFEAFAQYLDERPRSGNARRDLEAMGRAYVTYAMAHPLQYRLMFGTPLPNPEQHPDMMHSAKHAFALLRDCIGQMIIQSGTTTNSDSVELDALFVWSSLHGVASIMNTSTIDTLGLSNAVLEAAFQHVLRRIGAALNTPMSHLPSEFED